MDEVLVLAEHRMGILRDVSWEMLALGNELSGDHKLSTLLLGKGCSELASILSHYSDQVILVDHPDLKEFNAEAYTKILTWVINKRKSRIVLIGHTSYGINLAPVLATRLGIPLATDCIDVKIEEEDVVVTRQMYGGKLNVEGILKKSEHYIITIRPANFEPAEELSKPGGILSVEYPHTMDLKTNFKEFVEPLPGEVDISDAEIIIGIGRGIKDEKNIQLVKELALALNGEIGCSRPIVDKGWLPKDRQVGSSGKTVKPKLYIASGISGSFQHVMGMKGSDLIVAINRDPKAPIFGISDYGVVDDLFKVLPAITDKVNELKDGTS
jgi:electron transfer flavoprotein alpha subunit